MSSSRELDWTRLVRVAKYLKTRPRLVMMYPWQQEGEPIIAHSDANWAGCKVRRKSTSGATIHIGKHLIKTYSKTQSLIALSSAESELYAMVRASAESLGIMALLEDFGKNAMIQFYVGASAALGVAQRHGIGKIRHLQTNCLWIQEKAVKQAIKYIKVHGSLNPADINTKNVSRELIDKHVAAMGCCFRDGRQQSLSSFMP